VRTFTACQAGPAVASARGAMLDRSYSAQCKVYSPGWPAAAAYLSNMLRIKSSGRPVRGFFLGTSRSCICTQRGLSEGQVIMGSRHSAAEEPTSVTSRAQRPGCLKILGCFRAETTESRCAFQTRIATHAAWGTSFSSIMTSLAQYTQTRGIHILSDRCLSGFAS